ncbi:MAG TPA: SDR family NAD(P)-dependent oxidoreductase [Pirellulaceae bacterium]|nr:SDR family NAD(P)-dependent oxidoreductase [Pirellulaceae bacterium]
MARRSLADLRVLVTGASSGIGRSLVKELLAHNARVVAMARRPERLAELAEEVGSGKPLRCTAGDVTAAADRRQVLDTCQREFGGLDVLVNNAGIGLIRPFAAGTDEEARRIFEVNFFAPLAFIRESLPLLRAGTRPLIVNVGSVLGHRAVPGKSEYCASKFAMHGFSDSLRVELAKDGIDVLLVSPSTTASEFFQQATGDPGTREGKTNAMTSDAVARQVVRAMRSGKREIILSAAGKLLVWLDRLSPPLADWLVARLG